MEKEYKLTKEYPNSPPLGTIIKKTSGWRGTYSIAHEYPEFWEEIKQQKDYEILSFKNIDKSEIITNFKDDLVVKNSRGLWGWTFYLEMGESIEEEMLKAVEKGRFIIHSVKRLLDGEIFTIGEEVEQGTIISFVNTQDGIKIRIAKTWCHLDRLKKVPKEVVIFTTEDGVKITDKYKGMLYAVNKISYVLQNCNVGNAFKFYNFYKESNVFFQSYEKAKEWKTRNTPCLSLKEISQIYITANQYNPGLDKPQGQSEKLYKFVQTKLKL